ncbi:MAG: DnaJ family molecular chaperone [Candidatus Brocadiales bacterium]
MKGDYKGKLLGGGLGWFAGGPLGTVLGATLGHLYDTVELKTEEDPYHVLGLDKSAPKEEVKRRYLELSAKYHPDKVSHLGKELINLAHCKFVEISTAYEKIRKERDS